MYAESLVGLCSFGRVVRPARLQVVHGAYKIKEAGVRWETVLALALALGQ